MLRLLSNGVNPEGAGRSLYFSYFYDVTLNAQRTAVIARDMSPAMQTAASRAEQQFFWNGAMSRPLIDAGAHRWEDMYGGKWGLPHGGQNQDCLG